MLANTIQNLTKSYTENKVLKGVSFVIQQKNIFSQLCSNDTGKTTADEILNIFKKAHDQYDRNTIYN